MCLSCLCKDRHFVQRAKYITLQHKYENDLQYGEQLHPSASEAQLSGADADAPVNADERRTDSNGRAKDGSRQLLGRKRGHDWDDGERGHT